MFLFIQNGMSQYVPYYLNSYRVQIASDASEQQWLNQIDLIVFSYVLTGSDYLFDARIGKWKKNILSSYSSPIGF